jgi:hypothetical protein
LDFYVYEVGNEIANQIRLLGRFNGFGADNKKYGVDDPDVGAKVEICTFGNKGIVGLRTGRLGPNREL